MPDIIPRPALPPPRSSLRLERGHGIQEQVQRRTEPVSQKKQEEKGFLWNIWKNSLGGLFDKKDDENRRSGRTNVDSVTTPLLDSIGKSMTRIFIKYATNEFTKLLDTNTVVRE